MNVEFNFKQGDCVFFTDSYNNDYIDIIDNYNPQDNSIEEIVSVMYKNRNGGDKEGSIYYRTTLFLGEVKDIRLATKDEVDFLKAALEDDGNMFDRNSMEVVSRETGKKKVFQLTRTVILGGFYRDTIEVEAYNLENALNIAEEMCSNKHAMWVSMDSNEIIMNGNDIKRIEITSEDGEDYREIDF